MNEFLDGELFSLAFQEYQVNALLGMAHLNDEGTIETKKNLQAVQGFVQYLQDFYK